LNAVEGSGELSSQCPGGVGIPSPIDHAHETFLEALSVEKSVEDGLEGIDDISAGVARPRFETEGGMPSDEITGDLAAGFFVPFEQEASGHAGKCDGGCVGFWLIVGDMRLLYAPRSEEGFAFQRDKDGG